MTAHYLPKIQFSGPERPGTMLAHSVTARNI